MAEVQFFIHMANEPSSLEVCRAECAMSFANLNEFVPNFLDFFVYGLPPDLRSVENSQSRFQAPRVFGNSFYMDSGATCEN